MKGYRYRIRLHSHDPQRTLPSEIEMIRREEETAREIILRLMSFVMAYEPELEPNGRPSTEVMPYSAALGRWSMEEDPLLWMECLPIEWKRLKKIITKAPRASILLATDSRADGEVALQKIRHDYKAGRFVVLCFDQAMIAEMQELLERQNELTFLPDATDPWAFQMDYNGNWFEGFWEKLDY